MLVKNSKDSIKFVRCFIALELSREGINEIEEIQNLVKKKNFFYGKMTEPENLHLTLKFLGEIDEDKIKAVKKKLKAIKQKEFEVSIGELGTFINKYNALFWIKLNGQEIWDLQKNIDTALLGIFPIEEKFTSHITLARMKKINDKKVFLEYIKNLKHREVKFKVKDFIFKKSELRPDGPVYSDLEKFKLEE
jgi:2'-5' RNA ligase